MTLPLPFSYADGRAEPAWLAARWSADVRARAAARDLVRRLEHRLAPGPAHGIDIGTGTGANHTYLSGELAVGTVWSVVDHDPDLLNHPAHSAAVHRLTTISELSELPHPPDTPSFVTCSAVLDVLRDCDVEALANVIAARRLPALFSLSVTGEVVIRPEDPLDHCITEAFNAHQCRAGRLGPAAPRRIAARFPAPWLFEMRTPWRLRTTGDAELMHSYLSERAGVAGAHERTLAKAAHAWLKRRLDQLRSGHLTIEVGHVDQLVLPT